MESKRHRIPAQYTYDGVILSGDRYPKSHLDRIKQQFQMRHDDIIIAAYPKSGNTWMDEIVWLLMNNTNVTKADQLDQKARVIYLEYNPILVGDKTNAEILEESESPRLMKTHMNYPFFSEKLNSTKPRVILGVRNVKDTLVSFYHFYRMNSSLGSMTGPFVEFFELFKDKELAFGDWFDYVLGYWNNRDMFNCFLLKYEDLHKDFRGTVRQLADFLGQEVTEEQLVVIEEHSSFDSMKNKDTVNYSNHPTMDMKVSPFMRKGKVGDWKNYFTDEQNDYVDNLIKEKLGGSGLVLDYEID